MKVMINFTPYLLYAWENDPRYTLHRSVGGAHSPSVRGGEENNPVPVGIEPQSGNSSCPSRK